MKFLILLLFFVSIIAAQQLTELAFVKIKELYSPKDSIIAYHLNFTEAELFPLEKKFHQRFVKYDFYVWEIKSRNRLIILDHVLGKVQPISYFVSFTENNSLDAVEVIKYRESHGFEIKDQRFLAQFTGNDSLYKVGENIKNISGATISVNSITIGINKLKDLSPLIRKKLNEIRLPKN
jgi:hypothetical protein